MIRLRRLLIAVAGLAALAAWLRRRIGRFEVADHSMAPVLEPGDYLITSRLRTQQVPERGDIVVFTAAGRYLAKRVIGLPGETVTIEGGVLALDGVPFTDRWWRWATRPDGEWTVPPDSWFVLGDNRADSAGDSRTEGPIRKSALHSVAVACYWPPGRARILR